MEKRYWLIDLDGVIWRGSKYIEKSIDALKILRSAGRDLIFFTNNSFSTLGELVSKLNVDGLDVPVDNILTSSIAACQLVHEGDNVLCVGGAGIREAVELKKAKAYFVSDLHKSDIKNLNITYKDIFEFLAVYGSSGESSIKFSSVVVGLAFGISFYDIALSANLIKNGALFIATNDDPSYPIQNGLEIPGAGSIVASIQVASQISPTVAGKPNDLAIQLTKAKTSDGEIEMTVGDRLSTDGKFATKLETRFGLVTSGIEEHSDLESADRILTCSNLYELVQMYFR
jgi:4-nitrophenyl phosphatase